MTDSDRLILDVAGDGRALFEFETWQANGHSCSGGGLARPMDGGWVYETATADGACRLEIRVTADGEIRFTDADWVCKSELCGARAVLDGLTFARDSQVDCAQNPSN